jgi:glycosyltransferase involved in cell wall biosynthesis
MRILVVCRDLGRGGTQRVAQNFAIAYQRTSHSTAVLAYVAGGLRRERLERAGIPVFVGHSEPTFEAIERLDPDVIHIHRSGMQNSEETDLLGRLRQGRRRVLETNVFSRVDYSAAMDLIDVHVHLSAWCLWKWRRWLGSSARKHAAVVLPNAVAPEDFQPATPAETDAFRAQHGIPRDAFLCGRVSQAITSKWHPQNILAFCQLAQSDPKAHMVLLGFPDSMRPLVDELPPAIRQRIVLLPMTDSDHELSVLYSSLDCFLHAARIGESFGLVLTEAMMCNCPVVTASRPHKDNSQLEVVGHRSGGLVAGSVNHLSEALLELWRNPTLRQSIRSSARRRILELYSADRLADRAVRVASIALESPDRTSLIQRLAAEVDIQTDVTDRQIAQLLANTTGRPSTSELFLKALVHRPSVQRMVRLINRYRLGS